MPIIYRKRDYAIICAAGDANCPEYIKLSKRAHRAILEDANVLEADDSGEVIITPEEMAQRVKDARAACLEDLDDKFECMSG